jgi:hypothetical protein
MPQLRPSGAGARARWLYRALNGSWVLLGIAAVLAAAQFYTDPASIAKSSIGRTLDGPADDVWNIAWALGGLAIAVGVWTVRPTLEIIGHLFFSVAAFINALAVLVILGPGPSAILSFGVGVASLTRVIYLWVTTPHRHDPRR